MFNVGIYQYIIPFLNPDFFKYLPVYVSVNEHGSENVYSDGIQNTGNNPQLEGLMELFYIRHPGRILYSTLPAFHCKN